MHIRRGPWFTVMATDLLEIGELAGLHTIAPDLPSKAPGPKCRRFPVIFDETDIVIATQGGKFETGQAATWEQGDWD